MEDYAKLKTQYIESAAYHEAGHVTAAIIQKMPLQDRGVHIDLKGGGISYYSHRVPGDLKNTERDREEREVTIVALYAGQVAQQTFFSDCPEECWENDRREVGLLLDEMNPHDEESRAAVEAALWSRTTGLVAEYWSLIESLAQTLLAKPTTPQLPIEIEQNWSNGQTNLEKWMSGSEIAEFFKGMGISRRAEKSQTQRQPDRDGLTD